MKQGEGSGGRNALRGDGERNDTFKVGVTSHAKLLILPTKESKKNGQSSLREGRVGRNRALKRGKEKPEENERSGSTGEESSILGLPFRENLTAQIKNPRAGRDSCASRTFPDLVQEGDCEAGRALKQAKGRKN